MLLRSFAAAVAAAVALAAAASPPQQQKQGLCCWLQQALHTSSAGMHCTVMKARLLYSLLFCVVMLLCWQGWHQQQQQSITIAADGRGLGAKGRLSRRVAAVTLQESGHAHRIVTPAVQACCCLQQRGRQQQQPWHHHHRHHNHEHWLVLVYMLC